MPNRNILIAIAAAIVVITGAVAAYFLISPGDDAAPAPTQTTGPAAPAGPPGALPDPVIGVLDRAAILQTSKVGQDIARQMQAFTIQARDRLAGERRALTNEAAALEGGNVPEPERAKRVQAYQAREQRFMNTTAREENILKAAVAAAHGEVAKVMGPILQEATKRRGVNMVLDRAAVPVALSQEFDLTADVIAQLDAQMPTYRVSLTPAK